jgi:outer membrane protein TolC
MFPKLPKLQKKLLAQMRPDVSLQDKPAIEEQSNQLDQLENNAVVAEVTQVAEVEVNAVEQNTAPVIDPEALAKAEVVAIVSPDLAPVTLPETAASEDSADPSIPSTSKPNQPDTVETVDAAKESVEVAESATAPKVATIGDVQSEPVSYVEIEAEQAAQTVNPENKDTAAETNEAEVSNDPKSAETIAEADLVASITNITKIPTAKPLIVPTSPTQVQIERVKPITLEEAVAIAVQNSEQITQSRIAVDRARAVLEEALAAFKPTVDAQVDYTVNDSAQARASNVASAFGLSQDTVSHRLNGTVGVNYNVFTSGRRSANVRVAENQLRANEADLNRVIQAVQLDVITAYYNTQSANEQVQIQQKSVENNQRSLQDTSALERAGVGTKFDVLQAEVQLANAQQDLLDAEARQRITRRELARQLNLSDTVDFTAADPIKPAPDWNKSIEESVLMALRNRSELDIRKLQREVARDQAKATLASLGPQVRVFANYDLFDDLTATGGVAMGYRFGAVLSMNLFDGGVARAQAKQRAADAALAESRFDQDADQIRFEVEQAYINLESRREQIDTAGLAVTSATEALRLARLRLSAGVGTQLEVIRSEDDLVRAEVNQLLAVIGYNQSLANLQRAINGL